jgi:hypothetical protein
MYTRFFGLHRFAICLRLPRRSRLWCRRQRQQQLLPQPPPCLRLPTLPRLCRLLLPIVRHRKRRRLVMCFQPCHHQHHVSLVIFGDFIAWKNSMNNRRAKRVLISRQRPCKTNNRRAFYDKFKRKEGDSLTQYTVYEGFVYFYNEGKIVDTQACFIVANDFGEFKKGRMLLMPPAPQEGQEVTTRLLRVYHNFNRPRGRPPHAGARKP